MPLGEWFKPPRQLMLAFLVVAMVSTSALAWPSWQLLAQDDLDYAADAAAAAADRQVAALEHGLDGPAPALTSGDFAVTVVITADGGLTVTPSGNVPFYPDVASSPDDLAFANEERLEWGGQLDTAAAAYARLSTAGSVSMRAGALTRLGRVARSRGDFATALKT